MLAFEEALQAKAPSDVTEHERFVLAIEALEREVNNGGFHQFFTNSSVEFVDVIADALQAVRCTETAEVVREAIESLGIDGAPTAESVTSIMDQDDDGLFERLGAFDDRFYSVAEPIADRLLAWISDNRATVRVGDA